jgi:hypothetical protein
MRPWHGMARAGSRRSNAASNSLMSFGYSDLSQTFFIATTKKGGQRQIFR